MYVARCGSVVVNTLVASSRMHLARWLLTTRVPFATVFYMMTTVRLLTSRLSREKLSLGLQGKTASLFIVFSKLVGRLVWRSHKLWWSYYPAWSRSPLLRRLQNFLEAWSVWMRSVVQFVIKWVFWECLIACKTELVLEQKYAEANVGKLKTSPCASVDRVCILEGELAHFNVAPAKQVWGATCCWSVNPAGRFSVRDDCIRRCSQE